MYRVTILSGNAYSIYMESPCEEDIEAVMALVNSGDPVLLVDDLESAADLLNLDIIEVES